MSNTWLMRHRPFRFHLSVSVSVSHSLDSLTHSLRPRLLTDAVRPLASLALAVAGGPAGAFI